MTVNKSTATIYASLPEGSLTPIADEILYGWNVTVLEEFSRYVRVKTEYGYEGYMAKSDLSEDCEGDYTVVAGLCGVVPTDEYKYPEIMLLPRLARVKVLEKGEKWTKILLADGREAFVRTLHIAPWHGIFARRGFADSIKPDVDLRQRIVGSAQRYLGTQYRWGGKSSLGIDCSGLCFMAYYENGINIYRDAEPDTSYTKRIPLDRAKPGDLLYFPGHIAMVTEGLRFIHASSALSMVGFNSLSPEDENYSEYLEKNLITAATVFDD